MGLKLMGILKIVAMVTATDLQILIILILTPILIPMIILLLASLPYIYSRGAGVLLFSSFIPSPSILM